MKCIIFRNIATNILRHMWNQSHRGLWEGGKDYQKVIWCYLWLLSHNITYRMIFLQFWKNDKIYMETMIKMNTKHKILLSSTGVHLWAIGKCAVFTSARYNMLYFIVICHVAYINWSVCYFFYTNSGSVDWLPSC